MSRIYVPATSVDDWQHLLADPQLHWKKGYSARALAHCWQQADVWPASIASALTEGGLALEPLIGLPEHKVPLPGGSRASQTDLFVLARDEHDGGLVAIAVEGKVAEPFGPQVGEWRGETAEGREQRLRYLCETLGLADDSRLTEIRYQLLHRTASAVIEARRFDAARAMMIVHSFSPEQAGHADYAAFAGLLGAREGVGVVSQARTLGDVELWLGWVAGEPRYLDV